MTDVTKQPGAPRAWCVLATGSPIAAVFVRMYGTPYTHIMRWHVDSGILESGAWTTLSIKTQRCHLSADGQFLQYLASGGLDSPFPADYGGGSTISRLPWLTALTKIDAWMKGVFDTATELSLADQERLRSIFSNVKPYFTAEEWPGPLGPGWRRTDSASVPESAVPIPRSRRGCRLVGERPIGSSCFIVAVLDRKNATNDRQDEPRFFLRQGHAKPPFEPCDLHRLPESWWANASPDGLLLIATMSGRLQALRIGEFDGSAEPWIVVQDHDLNVLEPQPGPSPEWARSPLPA